MKQFKLVLCLSIFGLWFAPLWAQQPAFSRPGAQGVLPGADLELTLGFASNYVDRGEDLFADRARQGGQSYGKSSGAAVFQPALTLHTPLKGLSFALEASLALEGRRDQDADCIYQQAPGGPDYNHAALSLSETLAGMEYLNCKENGNCAPSFYKEENGLHRSDELHLVLDYSRELRNGNVGFGVDAINSPHPSGKKDAQLVEVYVNYALPFFRELTFEALTTAGGDDSLQYYSINYENQFDLLRKFKIDFALGAGYGVEESMQGWKDVTGKIGFSIAGFSLALNAAYRPNLSFFDDDGNNSLPLWLEGGSTRGDGLVADPAKTNGLMNHLVNSLVTQELQDKTGGLYTYTPRAKLPRTLYWVSLDYTIEF